MKTSKKSKFVRLPAHVEPIRYKISLKPDLEAFTFEGQESIFLNLGKTVREITLHSKELEIETVKFVNKPLLTSSFDKGEGTDSFPSLQKRGQGELWAREIIYDKKSETATFKFDRLLQKGRGELHLVFRGVLNDKMRGFYRSKYTHEGREKYLATTQFEATDARRAFPCVDEPAAKAVFDVSLIVPGSATAISNTLPANIKEHEGGYKIVEFGSTPKMSTYLVAFIVGDFEFIEGRTKDRVLVRVFTTPGKKHQARFALQTAIKCLEFYNQYFAIPYPLPVLDLIAIPDFAAGAMENWGAVTYRESALLVDEEKSSAANKQWVALVIAHELAHQWFGNLVTMEWWTHLWLNEGFASYIEYLAVNHLFPKWDIWTQFAYNDLGIALRLDSLNTTHPIEVDVRHPDEIGEIFDEVSYSKGSSVIRMLADYLGEKDFRDGLRHYLKKHSYSNASTVHLWQAFEKVSKKPVEKIMRNWTSRPGYPLIEIENRKSKIEIEQTRFFSSPISRKNSKDKTVWQVPIKVQSSKFKFQSLLRKQNAQIKIPKADWLKVNPGESGFYRVSYSEEMLKALKYPIEHKQLSPIDRLGVVRDAFALAEAGQMTTVEALNLVESFKNEEDYNVWVELISGLDLLNIMLFGQKGFEDFKKFNRDLLKNIGRQVGWKKAPGESHTAGLLRSLVLHHLGYYGDAQTIKQAQNLFRSPEKISPDLRGVVYSLVASSGGNKEFQKFKAMHIRENLHEEKNRLSRALANFRKPKLLGEVLKFALSNGVRPQDSPGIIASVLANVHGREIAWNFVKKNWKIILKRFGEGGHMLPRMIKPAGLFMANEDAKDVRRFFGKNPAPGIARTVTQVLERIESNAAWGKRDKEKIFDWLKNNA